MQALWAFKIVAGDSPRCRDLVLSQGTLIPQLVQLNEHARLSMLRNATWKFLRFCWGKPQLPFDQFFYPASWTILASFRMPWWFVKLELCWLLAVETSSSSSGVSSHSNDEEVLIDACSAPLYIGQIVQTTKAGVCTQARAAPFGEFISFLFIY